eukprot:3696887-Alexandrium_andersonii.AAC.1
MESAHHCIRLAVLVACQDSELRRIRLARSDDGIDVVSHGFSARPGVLRGHHWYDCLCNTVGLNIVVLVVEVLPGEGNVREIHDNDDSDC